VRGAFADDKGAVRHVPERRKTPRVEGSSVDGLVARTGFEPVILRRPAGLLPFRITNVETSPEHSGPTAVGSENRGVSILASTLSRAAGDAVPPHLASQPIRLLYDVLQLPQTVKPWSEAMELIGAFPGSKVRRPDQFF